MSIVMMTIIVFMSIVIMTFILIVLVLWIVVVEFKQVCIPPEQETIASKASGNKYKHCKKMVCRCPKQQKTTQIDQYKLLLLLRSTTHSLILSTTTKGV